MIESQLNSANFVNFEILNRKKKIAQKFLPQKNPSHQVDNDFISGTFPENPLSNPQRQQSVIVYNKWFDIIIMQKCIYDPIKHLQYNCITKM